MFTLSKNAKKNRPFQAWIAAICIGFIVFYFWKHQQELRLIGKIPAINIIILLCGLTINNTLHSYRTLIILQSAGLKSIRFFPWLKIFTTSRLINHYIPQGANLYRLAKLKNEYQYSYTHSISMAAFFTWLDVIFYLSISLACSAILQTFYNTAGKSPTILISGCLAIFFATPFIVNRAISYVPTPSKLISWIKSKISTVTTAFSLEIRKTKVMAAYFLLTLIFYLILTFLMKICYLSLGYAVGTGELFLFTLVFLLTRTINIIPGNLGLAEIICGYFTAFMGITMGTGIIISGIIRILTFILLCMLTLILNRFTFRLSLPEEGS